MLRFTQYEKDIKRRAKQIAFARGRLLVVVALASLVLTAYFLIVGLGWQESEALKMGWMSAVLCLVCFLLYSRMYFVVKNIITTSFCKYATDGKIDFSLEQVNSTIKFTRMCDDKVFVIDKSEIKSICQLKTVNVFIFRDKSWLDLPNREDINELIKSLNPKK